MYIFYIFFALTKKKYIQMLYFSITERICRFKYRYFECALIGMLVNSNVFKFKTSLKPQILLSN